MSDDLIHDREVIRAGWDDDDPDVTRIVRRVGAALNSGRDKAVVDVVLDEVKRASGPMTDDDMLAHLVTAGVLERRPVCHEPGWTWLVSTEWDEVES